MTLALKNQKNLFSKLTRKRLVNSTRILASYYKSRVTGKQAIRGLPISIAIEPTTSCNLQCPQCPSGLRSFSRPTGMLQSSMLEKVLNELSPTLLYLTMYFQGEPYLHKNFLSFVKYASERNIYTSTSTNAHYLDDDNAKETVLSGLDRLIISVDGTTQDVYEKYRIGGSLEKVKSGIENLIGWKSELGSSTPHVIVQFVVFNHNEHQVEDILKWEKEIGVDEVTIKTAQVYDFEHGSELIPQTGKYSRYAQNGNEKWHIKNTLLDHCWKMWHSSVVTWDGNVVPCCFDKDGNHVMGNVAKHSFQEIWFGERYNQFRNALLTSRKEIDICKNCTEGTTVFV